jgi:hypothetical protein
MPPGHDEIGGNPIGSQVPCSLGVIDPDVQILVHLEMEVGRVHSVVITDRSHLLSPGNLLSLANIDSVHVGVE